MKKTLPLLVLLALVLPASAFAQYDDDDSRPGRFDGGKMWTFEYAPAAYFTETYGFDANEEWFERARMAALRIPGCSASFVSENGLLATNHHCIRGRLPSVQREGESLLDDGFYAATMEEERQIPGYHAEQLIAIEDVTSEIDAAGESGRSAAMDHIQQRLLREHRTPGDSVWVQIVSLYNGGRHSAYVFKRFTDVRLVMAVELQAGFFGGDPDNFTYPRYALDFAFLRVYDNGQPYHPSHIFGWGSRGVEEGDVVFVIGSPGSTSRLTTYAQLEYLRDFGVAAQKHWLESRHAVMGRFYDLDPVTAEQLDLRNQMFSLSNSMKAANGRLAALHSDMIMARRAAGERALRDSIAASPELTERYGSLFDEMAELQERRRAIARPMGAFFALGNGAFGSHLIGRAMRAYDMLNGDEEAREQLLGINDHPYEMELGFLAERLDDMRRYYGNDHRFAIAALMDGDARASAAAMLANSKLGSAAQTRSAVESGTLSMEDPAIAFIGLIMDEYREYLTASRTIGSAESRLAADLGRVKFEVYGSSVPPDGTRSPRITDGVVSGYEYNGTLAPPYTTFYGIYDRHFAHKGAIDWALADRWQTPPEGLDLGTPLNFVSTADTYGGNSGSPAVTRDLELVGLNFDRNINGLARDYIYLPEQGRNVMVDVRAVQAALEYAYGGGRLLRELGVLAGR